MTMAYVKSWKLLEEFRKFDADMPIQTAAMFLVVAANEGITMKALGEELGISQSSCSRNVAALSKQHRLNKPGLDLVYAEEDPVERRRKIVKLTPQGRRLAQAIRGIVEDA